MKRSHHVLAGIFTALSSWSALQGATVSITVNSNGGPMFATSGGQMLEFGDAVRVGYFSPASIPLIQGGASLAQLDSLFTPLGEGIADAGTVTQSGNTTQQLFINDGFSQGHVFGQVEGVEESYLNYQDRLYVWVFNDSNPLAATEWGIFSADSGWGFPMGNGSVVLSTFEIDNKSNEVLWGSYEAGQLRLIAVPEPSCIVLLAAAGFFHRRRRSSAQA